MRRSKSDPSKYARKYRSISQRRMTEQDDEGREEKAEMERLKAILQSTEQTLTKASNEEQSTSDGKRNRSESLSKVSHDSSPYELLEENDIIIHSKKPKASKSVTVVTPSEVRAAKLANKKTTRKWNQLTERATKRAKRAEIYQRLEKSAISNEERMFLSSSATRGKRDSKREICQKLLQRERAGLVLTQTEKELLYSSKAIDMDVEHEISGSKQKEIVNVVDQSKASEKGSNTNSKEANSENISLKGDDMNDNTLNNPTTIRGDVKEFRETKSPEANVTVESNSSMDTVANMLAAFTSLKKKTEEEITKSPSIQSMSQFERIALEEEKQTKSKPYKPTNPIVVKTAASLGIKPKLHPIKRTVLQINRPPEVKASRLNLPVSGMEYEIMDAIRNNDVTIVCSETGSGKSTQVPQFLYEGGMTLGCNPDHDESNHGFKIGITQPRRVAAVSTAKRVAYEMGHGDGQTINKVTPELGSLVAYQTRYESAGLGRNTKIKFMTDGILLQEIQSDLLLRDYGAIILDEAHERNLNTDVLLGLLSATIPLRKEASEEKDSKIKPLKLIIMSATLRIEDFTENDKLFPVTKPAVIRVPGRTHPVTIHHSKVTELDNYEEVACQKVIKIHRKLPQGGILLFLTGKQEIVRAVKMLRKRLNLRKVNAHDGQMKDISPLDVNHDVDGLRDLDDDDVDGDIFQGDDSSDIESSEDESTDNAFDTTEITADEKGIPKEVIILPLYSMLSVEEQAKVFAPIPEGSRLIVVTTNIAETSLTIPGISYVVDCGRQKCKNYHASTGVVSYDIMWISKAAADQRAGRAGRTGPGHCYRMYSSNMYACHMDDFAIPEVLNRPLEDVILAMKAMKVKNISNFPFPTPPDQSQVDAAVKLLANLGCLNVDNQEISGEDGIITRLGSAVAKLPLGVRYGKMLLVGAQAGILDYAIVMVAALSENSPFVNGQETERDENDDTGITETGNSEENRETIEANTKNYKNRWKHRAGDAMATVLAVGAYCYAGKGAGGLAEKAACRRFCDENGLSFSVMTRIHKMRLHLARLAKQRLFHSGGIAAKTGGILGTMQPPNQLEENLLSQAICSGLLDNVAMKAPPGYFSGDLAVGIRSAYISCTLKEPLFLDSQSALYTRDFRSLPEWICFDSMVRKVSKDGTPFVIVKNVTRIDPAWLGPLSKGSRLLRLGEPLQSPPPTYDEDKDAVLCHVSTKFGWKGWEIPPVQAVFYEILQEFPTNKTFFRDDSFRYFARFLLEGKVVASFKSFVWNDNPAIITRRPHIGKVSQLVTSLTSAGVDSVAALRKHWAEIDRNFLREEIWKGWLKSEFQNDSKTKKLWKTMVTENIQLWKKQMEL